VKSNHRYGTKCINGREYIAIIRKETKPILLSMKSLTIKKPDIAITVMFKVNGGKNPAKKQEIFIIKNVEEKINLIGDPIFISSTSNFRFYL